MGDWQKYWTRLRHVNSQMRTLETHRTLSSSTFSPPPTPLLPPPPTPTRLRGRGRHGWICCCPLAGSGEVLGEIPSAWPATLLCSSLPCPPTLRSRPARVLAEGTFQSVSEGWLSLSVSLCVFCAHAAVAWPLSSSSSSRSSGLSSLVAAAASPGSRSDRSSGPV